MAFGALKYMNKSDYAFNSSVCRPKEPGHATLRHIMEADGSLIYHDNKEEKERTMFENGDLTFGAMLELSKNEGRMLEAMRRAGLANSWGVPRCLRLCGGGESSLNTASGWGSPPNSNNGQYYLFKSLQCPLVYEYLIKSYIH